MNWFVRRSWGLMNWFVGIITWSSFVGYFNNVTRVAISSVVLYNLRTAIWKGNTVFTISRVTITSFICAEVDSRIIISNSIFVLIFSWDISVSWFFVGWGVVSWSGFVNWGWVVNWGWLVDRSWLVSWSSMVNWSMSYSMAVSW